MTVPHPVYLPDEIAARDIPTIRLRLQCANMYNFMRGVGYTADELLFRYKQTAEGRCVGCEVVPVSLRDVYPAPTPLIAEGEKFARYPSARVGGSEGLAGA
jgi:hypothetical protein